MKMKVIVLKNFFGRTRSVKYLGDFIIFIMVFYALLVIIFSILYFLIARAELGNSADYNQWFYFSIVTLTTVGFGDITPINDIMRLLASVEAFIGYISPSIIISVGLALIFKENNL